MGVLSGVGALPFLGARLRTGRRVGIRHGGSRRPAGVSRSRRPAHRSRTAHMEATKRVRVNTSRSDRVPSRTCRPPGTPVSATPTPVTPSRPRRPPSVVLAERLGGPPPLPAHRDLPCTPRRRRSTRGPQGDARRPVRNPLLTRVLTSTVPASHLGSAPTFGAPVPAVTSATGHRLRATTKRRAPARSAPRRAPVRRPVCSTPRDAHGRTVVLPARHCPAVFRPACPGRGAPDGRRRPRTRPYLPALPRR